MNLPVRGALSYKKNKVAEHSSESLITNFNIKINQNKIYIQINVLPFQGDTKLKKNIYLFIDFQYKILNINKFNYSRLSDL